MQSRSGISPPVLIHDRLYNGYERVDTYIHITGLELGPALGGCRIHHYERDSEAQQNAERLSRCMQLKSALRKLPYGGGKTVIIADPDIGKNRRLLQNYAAMVNERKGDYITAEDTGTDVLDMDYLSKFTGHVVGVSKFSGNPSPVTAYGVYHALLAALRHKGHDSIEGLTLALKGAGSVAEFLVFGFPEDNREYDEFRKEFPGLIRLKPKAIYFTDSKTNRLSYFKSRAKSIDDKLISLLKRRSPEDIYEIPRTDIFIPAAVRYSVSGTFLEHLVGSMKDSPVRLVVGPENNQLKDEEGDMKMLQDAGITYIPDYAANAGGLLNVHFGKVAKDNNRPYQLKEALAETAKIGDTTREILAASERTGKATITVARELAERYICEKINPSLYDPHRAA